ncbi:hypothetical protein MRX96_012993 [Rhipicephalus microplus]
MRGLSLFFLLGSKRNAASLNVAAAFYSEIEKQEVLSVGSRARESLRFPAGGDFLCVTSAPLPPTTTMMHFFVAERWSAHSLLLFIFRVWSGAEKSACCTLVRGTAARPAGLLCAHTYTRRQGRAPAPVRKSTAWLHGRLPRGAVRTHSMPFSLRRTLSAWSAERPTAADDGRPFGTSCT